MSFALCVSWAFGGAMALFITSVDKALAEKGLGFVSTIIDIALILLATFLVVFLLRHVLNKAFKLSKLHLDQARQNKIQTLRTLVVSIIKYITYFMAAALIASELGFGSSVRSLLAAAGIGGVVLGIGAQSLISDIVSGFFLLFEDQFCVGDYVSISGITGTVEAITLRTTTIRAFTGEISVVPNGSIKALTNYSRSDSLAVIDAPVAIDADCERVKAIMLEEGERMFDELKDRAAAKPQMLGVNAVSAYAKTLRMIMPVKPLEHWAVQRELTERIYARFVKEGVKLAGCGCPPSRFDEGAN